MKLNGIVTCCVICLLADLSTANAQLYKIELNNKIAKASLIVEGKVTDQYSFWNDAHNMIYTSNTIHVYKLFKGRIVSGDIEVLTQGGSVDNKCLVVSDVLQLHKDETGMFFLYENGLHLQSPLTKKILFDVYSSEQGFLRYDETGNMAFAPFAKYDNLQQTLYNLVRQGTGTTEKIIDNNEHFITGASIVSNGTAGAIITSFSPALVHGGALNDPANNILTINGSGFGSTPSGSAGILFKDANNDHVNPDYKINYTSPYIISWTDNKITVNVPDRAGTGKFAVETSDGTTVNSSTDLDVFYSVLNARFNNGKVVREPRLMDANGSGGYTIQYSTSTAGQGKDFTASPAKATFERALATWKEITGANLIVGSPTPVQAVSDDQVNIVVFDNNNTGVPKMADGVLESTYSWFSACTSGTNILTAQKTGFDIVIRNENVSLGSKVSFEFGPCFPATGSYDLEMIILHELGHALNLAHINDDYENGGAGYPSVNPSKLMHYAILDYVDRRSPDASAYQGVLYTITPQGNTYGSCGLFASEMSPLPATPASNDECPGTFPSTELQNNTSVFFDLTHATSNKFTDPSFEQVLCSGSGTSVTNNVYYAFYTGGKSKITIDIKNYTTTPVELASCNGQQVRLSLYDVQSCPAGQAYPLPIVCGNFNKNGSINISGLQQNHKYLLYFDGFRNTKASFTAVFDSDSSSQGPEAAVTVFPNPIINSDLTVRINNATGSFYEYGLFDAVGKLLATGKVPVNQSIETFSVTMKNVAAGVYFLRLVDDSGKVIEKIKILKQNQ